MGETADLRMQLWRDWIHAEPFKCIHQRVRKTVLPITMLYHALALYIVQDFAHLLGREFVVIEKRNEARDRTLKVNVVFPEGVVCVDEEGLWLVGGSNVDPRDALTY